MKRWPLPLILGLAACGDADPPSSGGATTPVTASARAGIGAPIQADPAEPKRKLAQGLVRRAALDLTEGRAGDSLPADQRRSMDDEAKAACERSDPLACTLHGGLVESAGGDAGQSTAAYIRGCSGGDMLACARLALYWPCHHPESRLRYKVTCPDDLKAHLVAISPDPGAQTAGIEGARLAGQRACDAGEPVGCVALAQSLEEIDGDKKRAFSLLERACEMGSYSGCERAVRTARQSLDDDKAAQIARRKWAERALPMLVSGCRAKNELVCAELAAYYEGSWGAPADMPQAKVHHLEACALGLKESCARAKLFK